MSARHRRRHLPVAPLPLVLMLVFIHGVAVPGAAVQGAGTDTSSVRRGQILVGTLLRTFDYFVPPQLSDSAPLVLVFHGSGGSGARIRRFLGGGIERLAGERGFIVAYPDGFGGNWNDCRAGAPFEASRRNVDDVSFVRELVHWLAREYGGDPKRTRIIGYSNGGHMAFRLALEAPDEIEGIVAFGANLPVPEDCDCTPAGGATAVMVVNGTSDPINPYDGGEVIGPGGVGLGRVKSSDATVRDFAARAGYTGTPASLEVVAPGEPGGMRVEKSTWLGARVSVALYTIHGAGHTIPGPRTTIPAAVGSTVLGETERRFDGIAEAMRFFDRHVEPRTGSER